MRLGGTTVVIAGVLLAAVAPACDWTQVLGDPDVPPATSHPPADAAPPVGGPVSVDGGPAPDAGTAGDPYQAMCRHYCQALEETDLLVCLSSGKDVNDCQATTPTAGTCFQLRCVPRRVDVALCLEQCSALASRYDGYCPVVAPASDPLCPTSPADHDAACRAGCVL